MIVGVGIDFVKIARFRDLLKRKGDKFINRIYHVNEIKNRPKNSEKDAQYFASR
jgi:phosphopantetheine--protein transferase-like protein